ncbi:DUF4286 family protein [Lunatibacter salilacus]|uniref:DUF4286 family protein n=1 Tax=Lunatibacter salilacus TaxID=2483804 RepID=UPI00131DB953|nr:DUF4286 family protein [Lunatibacter salilacus]HSI77551.1 DUF4286 family protein [Lunatimonas sp.]
MIVYNVTVNILAEKEAEFVAWMKQTYIPRVMETGFFVEHRFLKLLQEQEDGINFAAQFHAETMEKMLHFDKVHAKEIDDLLHATFQNEYISFRSLLETIE